MKKTIFYFAIIVFWQLVILVGYKTIEELERNNFRFKNAA